MDGNEQLTVIAESDARLLEQPTVFAKQRLGWIPLFLETLAKSANIGHSCKVAQVSQKTVGRTRHRNPEFAAACEEAMQEALDLVEMKAREGALEGFEKSVPDGLGGWVTVRQAPSERLIMFILKNKRPQVYGDKLRLTDDTRDGETVTIQIHPDFVTEEELITMRAIAARTQARALAVTKAGAPELPAEVTLDDNQPHWSEREWKPARWGEVRDRMRRAQLAAAGGEKEAPDTDEGDP